MLTQKAKNDFSAIKPVLVGWFYCFSKEAKLKRFEKNKFFVKNIQFLIPKAKYFETESSQVFNFNCYLGI